MRKTGPFLFVAGFLALAGTSLPGQAPEAGRQAPAQAGQPPPTFKVEVNYVEIDATVTDAQGRVVDDLTKDDFQVLEEGKPQVVSAFTRVDLPIERQDPLLFRRAAIEPDVRSNREAFMGRIFLMVLDDLQTDFRRTTLVRAAARQFVRRFVGANDMVAVVTTGGSASAGQEFTSSHARLIAAVDKFMGQKRRDSPDMERSFKARNTYATLGNLAEYLAAVRGRRKAIVWFGEGVDYNIDNAFASRDADVVRMAMQDVIAAATRANVSIYGIDARGVGAGLDEAIEITGIPDDTNNSSAIQNEVRRAQDSLRTVSEDTGGFAVVNQNDLNSAFGRIVQENSSYYLLGYYAANPARDGRFRSVQVRVTRPGLTVRARKGYLAPRKRPPSKSPANRIEAQMPPEVREALASPIPSRDLGLTVFAAPFAGIAPKASIAMVIEVDPGGLTFVRKDGTFDADLEVHLLAIDAAGKVQGGGRDVAPLRLREANHEMVTKNGLRLTRRLQLAPGRYQIHVVARETNGGRLGTIRQDLDVPDFSKGPLLMSGITLTSESAARIPTVNPDPGFQDVLPASPTAVRDFPRSDTLGLFVEVYDNQTAAAHRVAITTTVAADDGRVVFTAEDERASQELQGKKGGYGYLSKIPLAELAPGRYVLRVEARTLLAKGGTAARELEFRVR
jgi:VWFA-related protein